MGCDGRKTVKKKRQCFVVVVGEAVALWGTSVALALGISVMVEALVAVAWWALEPTELWC